MEGMSAVTAGERCHRYGTELTTNEGKKRVVENFELRSGEKHLLSNQSQSLLFSFRKIVDQIVSNQSHLSDFRKIVDQVISSKKQSQKSKLCNAKITKKTITSLR